MVFPTLKTGVTVQYPARRVFASKTETLYFVDGSEQRFQDSPGAIRRWELRFERLDDAEVQRLQEFFRAVGGRFGSFSFTDPADGTVHAACSFGSDSLDVRWSSEHQATLTLTILENRP